MYATPRCTRHNLMNVGEGYRKHVNLLFDLARINRFVLNLDHEILLTTLDVDSKRRCCINRLDRRSATDILIWQKQLRHSQLY